MSGNPLTHDRISSTDRDVLAAFRANFSFLGSEPLVLYGIGEKTRVLLDHIGSFNVVGLMDKSSTGCIVYGKKVLSADEVVGRSRHIVIISNYASSHLIYRRIDYLEKQHDIEIYHLNGTRPKDVCNVDTSRSESIATGQNAEDLKRAIRDHDVISFDLFDTLLMRACLSPTDIFQLVERKLSERYGMFSPFAGPRIEAERIAQAQYRNACTLASIYQILGSKLNWSDDEIERALDLELETEMQYIIPRDSIVEAMGFAKSLDKVVVITSDVHLPSRFIERLLARDDIRGYDSLFISCEVGLSKFEGGVWENYLELYRGKRVLHIGDDEFADILQPSNYEISTFKVQAASELLNRSSLRGLVNKAYFPDDRALLGRLTSCLFNDPFVLSGTDKVTVPDFYSAGYAFFGPLVMKFMLWLIGSATELGVSRLFFLSRDGFILERLFRYYHNIMQNPALLQGTYFYTSRRSLSVSSIHNADDIAEVFRLAPYVTRIEFSQFLFATFGVGVHSGDRLGKRLLYEVSAEELLDHILREYAPEILDNAKDERMHYQKYFESLGLTGKERIGIVNFVSGGITQHFFEKLFPRERMDFFYFQTRVDFEDVSTKHDAHALYGKNLSSYTDSSNALIRHYLTAESVFSAPDEQFVRFSATGAPVFECDNGKRNFSGIAHCHEGMERFFQDMIQADPDIASRDFSNSLIDGILGIFFMADQCVLPDTIRQGLNIRDSFSPQEIVQTLAE